MCPLFILDDEPHKGYDYIREVISHMVNNDICKINDELNIKLNNAILCFKEHNILDKKGTMPYIEVKKERKDVYDPWLDESYNTSFVKTKEDNVYYCMFDRHTDIILYTDIITENPKKIKNAKITIGDCLYCSTENYTRISDNVHRLCWNIDNIDSNINYDRNALWIPSVGLQYMKIKLMIEYLGDINELSLKTTGMCIRKERYTLAVKHVIRPRIIHDKDKDYVNIDRFMLGMWATVYSY
jgi:hypothetical protein